MLRVGIDASVIVLLDGFEERLLISNVELRVLLDILRLAIRIQRSHTA
jgi:hypothetical protein